MSGRRCMAVDIIGLGKLLRLFYMTPRQLTTALRSDIRIDIARSAGTQASGGDFYSPFWSDAKNHVAGLSNLHVETEGRIARNPRRQRLYPLLEQGFLQWWNENRRWTNQEFEFLPNSVKGRYQVSELDAVVKVVNILGLRIDDGTNRIFYPYFSEDPRLHDEGARIGLWLLNSTLSNCMLDDLRILDIFRAHSFSILEHPLRGNEEELFISKYQDILDRWAALREEYS